MSVVVRYENLDIPESPDQPDFAVEHHSSNRFANRQFRLAALSALLILYAALSSPMSFWIFSIKDSSGELSSPCDIIAGQIVVMVMSLLPVYQFTMHVPCATYAEKVSGCLMVLGALVTLYSLIGNILFTEVVDASIPTYMRLLSYYAICTDMAPYFLFAAAAAMTGIDLAMPLRGVFDSQKNRLLCTLGNILIFSVLVSSGLLTLIIVSFGCLEDTPVNEVIWALTPFVLQLLSSLALVVVCCAWSLGSVLQVCHNMKTVLATRWFSVTAILVVSAFIVSMARLMAGYGIDMWRFSHMLYVELVASTVGDTILLVGLCFVAALDINHAM